MAELGQASYARPTLESLRKQQSARRLRPSALDISTVEESRVPLKGGSEKMNRRESRLGLRSIFGRSKPAAELAGPTPPAPPGDLTSRQGDNRASVCETANSPYGAQAPRSEITLPRIPQAPVLAPPPKIKQGTSSQRRPSGGGRARAGTTSPRSARGSSAAWDPPPLFQAYPQAIRYARLSACTQSAESILRVRGSKGSVSLREDINQATAPPGSPEEAAQATSSDKGKKRHRRNTSGSAPKLDWTTKIYVLVTSGYLLQYSGEGSFDRLPEKMLHLSKDSAAFASDLIPGRHWVVHVSSIVDADGTASPDSRSLFSRLQFRNGDRRNASNFLMIFDGAEDMEGWITTIRREIEALGGKKNLSETGKPKLEADVGQLRSQTSQRTLVLKDHDRFSKMLSHELPWNQGQTPQATDVQDFTTEQSLDDVSATTSFVSQDGRQLDSLRDSQHRLSYVSSGQRTIVTSAASSPACSPTCESFASSADDAPMHDMRAEALPRPNAAAILERRQSMQAATSLADLKPASHLRRPLSTYNSHAAPDTVDRILPSQPTIPNFSVPHAISKRYSLARSPPPGEPAFAPPATIARPTQSRTTRKPPPAPLGLSRPLSVVTDRPCVNANSLQQTKGNKSQERTVMDSVAEAPDTPSMFTEWGQKDIASHGNKNNCSLPSREPRLTQQRGNMQPIVRTSPRKYASLQGLRTTDSPQQHMKLRAVTSTHTLLRPNPNPAPQGPLPPVPNLFDDIPRSTSSLGTHAPVRGRSPAPPNPKQASFNKRASYSSRPREPLPRLASVTDLSAARQKPVTNSAACPRSLRKSPSLGQHLAVDKTATSRLNRRSMPQLLEGPPPAPPPSRALPAIPQRHHDLPNLI